jgi:prophage antirepressor-like protein
MEQRTVTFNQILKENICGKSVAVYGSIEHPYFWALDISYWLDVTPRCALSRIMQDNRKKWATVHGENIKCDGWVLTKESVMDIMKQLEPYYPKARYFSQNLMAMLEEAKNLPLPKINLMPAKTETTKNLFQTVSNAQFGNVRICNSNDEPFFCASDVAKNLGYSNYQEAVRMHCKGVREILTPTNGGNQNMKYIPESDVYRLIVKSKLPAAQKFEKWIFETVLPSIRKTGKYNETTVIDSKPVKMIEAEARLNNSRVRVATKWLQIAKATKIESDRESYIKHAALALTGNCGTELAVRNG